MSEPFAKKQEKMHKLLIFCSVVVLSAAIPTVDREEISQDMIQAIAKEIVKDKTIVEMVQSRSVSKAKDEDKIETVSQVLAKQGYVPKRKVDDTKEEKSKGWFEIDEKKTFSDQLRSTLTPIKDFFKARSASTIIKDVANVKETVARSRPKFYELFHIIGAVLRELFEIMILFWMNFFEPLND